MIQFDDFQDRIAVVTGAGYDPKYTLDDDDS